MIVRASAAISLDGYLNDTSSQRLILSSPEDWAEVKAARAACDAILIGAETLRQDDPALVTRQAALIAQRKAAGKTPDPVKVTVSRSGNLDPKARFFTEGSGEKIVFLGAKPRKNRPHDCKPWPPSSVCLTPRSPPQLLLDQLESRRIHSLFIEGWGPNSHAILAAECRRLPSIGHAPFFVGEAAAPRWVGEAQFPFHQRTTHASATLRSGRGHGPFWNMLYAIPRKTTPGWRRRSRWPKIVLAAKQLIVSAPWWSPLMDNVLPATAAKTAPTNHAEEEAIQKALHAGCSLHGATIYSSMEPCSTRKSKPLSCSALILHHGLQRVVFATYEPSHFVQAAGKSC